MLNPSGFRIPRNRELETEELQDGVYSVRNAYEGEYDYFRRSSVRNGANGQNPVNVENITSRITSQINGVYVQQFLANVISVLQSYKVLAGEASGIPQLVSAYPRRLLERQLDCEDLRAVVEDRDVGISTAAATDYVERLLHGFLRTQRESVVYGYEKVDVRKLLQGMEETHPEFYEFRPLHEPDLRRIFEAEGVRVIPMERLPVLAALINYRDLEDKARYAVLLKDDATVPQALKEFAIAHELGHWVAHVKRQPEGVSHLDFYLHSFHDLGPFENEANKIALLTLFPTPYLSWRDIEGKLKPDDILEEFTEGMTPNPGGALAANVRGFIERRIESYHHYRRLWLELLRLPRVTLKKDTLGIIIETLFADFGWAILNAEYLIVDVNEKFASLVGTTRTELLASKRNILDLTEHTSRATTERQLEDKRKDLTPKFYITKYRNLQTKEVIPVTIYSFPVVDADMIYTGSFGLVTDIREGVWNIPNR